MHALAYGLTLVTADRALERLRPTRENWDCLWVPPGFGHHGRLPDLEAVGEAAPRRPAAVLVDHLAQRRTQLGIGRAGSAREATNRLLASYLPASRRRRLLEP